MNDIDIISKLEKELEFNFQKVNVSQIFEIAYYQKAHYALDLEKNVIGLKIIGFKLSKIHFSITMLSKLKYLNLFNNFITGTDLDTIKEMSHLEILDLSSNNITSVSYLRKLDHLTVLNLFGNKIEDISALKGLNQLTSLNLSNNIIKDISSLKELRKLSTLNLFHNDLHDISPLSEIIELKSLDLSSNRIANILPLKRLKKLNRLDLQNNPLNEIPTWVTEFDMEIQWEEYGQIGFISFFNNPTQTLPIEIIQHGKIALKSWLIASKKKLSEIKVLLVGDAKAGKTSVCRKLKYNIYEEEQNQTDGIIIEPFVFNELKTFTNQIKLHSSTGYFWDFGGQEIMSSTHQFFMTKRSLYLLVLEARRDTDVDKQVRQWLERIQTFGGNSPVILVGNKIDLNPSFGVDTTALKRDYPQIQRFINVSCVSGENIENLRNALEDCIPLAELFNTEIDERWIDIKNNLQKITSEKYKLSHKQFISICKKNKLLETGNQIQAIRFLNDLGIVLHFDELHLAEYFVLDPLWVTSGVYRIITSHRIARQKGIISVNELPRIINEDAKNKSLFNGRSQHFIQYEPNECKFLADIMVQFKLGYYVENNSKLLIPDLLDKETPKDRSDSFYQAVEKLSLVYAYKYLPPAVMPRIMVELKEDVELAWRTGVILQCKKGINATAMITNLENKIKIIVLGDYRQKRDYLSVIRYVLDQINTSYNVEVNLQIPLPGFPEIMVEYDELIGSESMGNEKYTSGKLRMRFPISQLLDGILTKDEVRRQAESFLTINNTNNMGDNYYISGQAGSVGPNSTATGNVFNQLNNSLPEETDFKDLTNEFAVLKQTLLLQAKLPEHYKAIGEIAAAEEASKVKDGNRVVKSLASAGKWALDIAKDVAKGVLKEVIDSKFRGE